MRTRRAACQVFRTDQLCIPAKRRLRRKRSSSRGIGEKAKRPLVTAGLHSAHSCLWFVHFAAVTLLPEAPCTVSEYPPLVHAERASPIWGRRTPVGGLPLRGGVGHGRRAVVETRRGAPLPPAAFRAQTDASAVSRRAPDGCPDVLRRLQDLLPEVQAYVPCAHQLARDLRNLELIGSR